MPAQKVHKTPKGRRWWGGKVGHNKYSYWIKYGDEEDELFHIDAKGAFEPDEMDDLTDFLLWMHEENAKKKNAKK